VIVNIDPHVHTECSSDSRVLINKVQSISRRKGLNGVAITNQNSIEGALGLKDQVADQFVIIVGEEIETAEGEITGLFLRERVPAGLSPENTAEKIKLQGGLVCITHPSCRFRKSKIKFEALTRIIEFVDIIEIFNSRNLLPSDNKKANLSLQE